MTTAAVIVASVSAAIALMSLLVNVMVYRLTGARLKVRLIPAVLTSRTLIRGADRGWRGRPAPEDFDRDVNEAYVDLAIIKVTNIGRTAVSVSDIALDFGRAGWGPRSRQVMATTPVEVLGCRAPGGDVRLETGESFSVAMDHEPSVQDALDFKNSSATPAWVRRLTRRSIVVRATATGARRRPSRSPRRSGWRAKAGDDRRIYYPRPPSAQHDAFLAVFRAVYPHDTSKVFMAWTAVRSLWLQDRADANQIGAELARILGVEPMMNVQLTADALRIATTLPEQMTTTNGRTVKRGEWAEEDVPSNEA